MKRPAFQFYAGDWMRNAKLRRCSSAARGTWIDTMCLFHNSDEYGILRWPLGDVANAIGAPIKLLRELSDKGVLKGTDKACAAYVYIPRHAGKNGTPVILLPANDGPCWYSSRMVRDEYLRQHRGASTRFGGSNGGHEDDNDPPLTLRALVSDKTGGKCHLCGEVLRDPWEIDHRQPVAKGGSEKFENLWPACLICNRTKGAKEVPSRGEELATSRWHGDGCDHQPSHRQGGGAAVALAVELQDLHHLNLTTSHGEAVDKSNSGDKSPKVNGNGAFKRIEAWHKDFANVLIEGKKRGIKRRPNESDGDYGDRVRHDVEHGGKRA